MNSIERGEGNMITANEFDLVFDCQQVFKQLMQAMANPGKVFSIGCRRVFAAENL